MSAPSHTCEPGLHNWAPAHLSFRLRRRPCSKPLDAAAPARSPSMPPLSGGAVTELTYTSPLAWRALSSDSKDDSSRSVRVARSCVSPGARWYVISASAASYLSRSSPIGRLGETVLVACSQTGPHVHDRPTIIANMHGGNKTDQTGFAVVCGGHTTSRVPPTLVEWFQMVRWKAAPADQSSARGRTSAPTEEADGGNVLALPPARRWNCT